MKPLLRAACLIPRFLYVFPVFLLLVFWGALAAWGQVYGPPDRGQPGDEMIQAYLKAETEKMEAQFLTGVTNSVLYERLRPKLKEEYFYMLGLWPLPERTPLQAKVTGSLSGEGYRVEMVHFQSRPRLYVTGNLYRPATVKPGERLPAVLYVCGHSFRPRNGNKTAYQSHGIWFARHGYICLMLDTLQLGEIGAIHHGTYRENRWWWHSRGYTPAGVECWNGMRAIDYLQTLPDVDPTRIAVTGISGGGAASFWIAAADERAKIAIPVSGMADLMSYIPNRVINGHCDCMFLNNTFGWHWTQIAGLIAPRPLLFVNSDHDSIFPMDANERVINRLKRLYSLYGASDMVDCVVSMGGHAYRQDIRQAAFRFVNMHFKNDAAVVRDSEVDLVAGDRNNAFHPIAPEKLRVFPTDADLPTDELNTKIDEEFVPMAQVDVPRQGEFESWKKGLLSELRRVTFRTFPERIPPAHLLGEDAEKNLRLETEPGIQIRVRSSHDSGPDRKAILLVIEAGPLGDTSQVWKLDDAGKRAIFICEPRGFGHTQWTVKNPPNYVVRSHALLGRTVDTGRVWDIIATARYLREKYEGKVPVVLLGEEAGAVLAAYAAIWEPDIAEVRLFKPMLTHMTAAAPQFLNVLRVCDVPEVLGMLAPRRLTITGIAREELPKAALIYTAAGASDRITLL